MCVQIGLYVPSCIPCFILCFSLSLTLPAFVYINLVAVRYMGVWCCECMRVESWYTNMLWSFWIFCCCCWWCFSQFLVVFVLYSIRILIDCHLCHINVGSRSRRSYFVRFGSLRCCATNSVCSDEKQRIALFAHSNRPNSSVLCLCLDLVLYL